MSFRKLLRLVLVAIVTLGALNVATKYAAEQCSRPGLGSSRPCGAFHVYQQKSAIFHSAAHDWYVQANDYVQSKEWTHHARAYGQAAKQKLVEAELDKRAKSAYDASLVWIQTELRPAVARRSLALYDLLHQHAFRAWQRSSQFVSTRAVPIMKDYSAHMKQHVKQLFWRVWYSVEASHVFQDVVAPQVRKIYDTVLAKEEAVVSSVAKAASAVSATAATPATATTATASAVSASSISTASASASAPTLKIATAPNHLMRDDPLESAAYAEAVNASAAAAESQAAKAQEEKSRKAEIPRAAHPKSENPIVEPEAEPEAKPEAEPEAEPETEPETEPMAKATPQAIPAGLPMGAEPKVWFKRVARTVEQAKLHLEEDAQDALEATIKAARPEIMELLRNITSYGDKAVRNMTILVEEVESRSKKSRKITKDDIFPMYDETLQAIASMAFRVRDRVEQLAKDSLESLDPVRLVTLDAIDDYFDVVLGEAARELTGSEEWDGWKEYHRLKQEIKQYRAEIEGHDFDMELVNGALRESQTASLLLAQELQKRLTELRARAQLVFQERKEPAKKDESTKKAANKTPVHDTADAAAAADEAASEKNAAEQGAEEEGGAEEEATEDDAAGEFGTEGFEFLEKDQDAEDDAHAPDNSEEFADWDNEEYDPESSAESAVEDRPIEKGITVEQVLSESDPVTPDGETGAPEPEKAAADIYLEEEVIVAPLDDDLVYEYPETVYETVQVTQTIR